MEQEFNLSEHITELEEGLVIHPDKVKEFIKRLKEKTKGSINGKVFCDIIDKLAGDKLI